MSMKYFDNSSLFSIMPQEEIEFYSKAIFPESPKFFQNELCDHTISEFFSIKLFSDLDTTGSLDDCDNLIFIDKDYKLKKINLENFKIFTIPTINTINATGGICARLSNDKYFINGGIDEERNVYNNSFIFTLTDQSLTETIPSKAKKFVAAGVAKDKKVYSFGGFSNFYLAWKSVSDSECYDIIGQSWSAIAPLPVESFWNTSSVVDNKIYLAGFLLPDLLIYDELLNNYTTACEIGGNHRKLIIENWVIVSNSNEIIEITSNGIAKHHFQDPWKGHYLLVNCTFKRGKWIYYLEGHSNEKRGTYLRRFDTVNKIIEGIEFF